MTLPRLISFSGRKGSGKTELAKVCTKYGYILINFADNLKNLVSKSLCISREELEYWKDEELCWDLSNKLDDISKELNIDYKIIKKYCTNQFNSIRQILQVLGTDVIRNYNPDWHVNKTLEYIKKNSEIKKYCIGDCRFKNEKDTIEALGGECWFVIRPDQTKISNHISEIELNWSFFGNKVIINSMKRDDLIWRWDNYLYKRKMGLESDPFVSNNLINFSFLYPNERSIYLLGFFRGSDIYFKKNMLSISNQRLLRVKMLKIELERDYTINAINSIDIYNPYIIENLKLWNLFNNNDEIPKKIRDDESFTKAWVIGLIDSSGTVDYNRKYITINLSSKEILEFICERINICFSDVCKKHNEKYILSLKENVFDNFVKWLGDTTQIGLIENWYLNT